LVDDGGVKEDTIMAKPLVSDELWERIEPLIPLTLPSPKGGRPRISDRAALTGILFVLRTGIQWEMLPQEMGCGSGMTCWRRLRDWHEAGVWQRIWEMFLNDLGKAEAIEWRRAIIDSSSVRAVFGGHARAPTPRIAGKTAANAMS
jgi:transposase